jgi:molybdate transport system substrate-binding protein
MLMKPHRRELFSFVFNNKHMFKRLTLLLIFFIGCSNAAYAQRQLTIAVAANFEQPLKQLLTQFNNDTPHDITVISGGTGSLYQQIVHGAPFDIFLAANQYHPQQLVEQHLTQGPAVNYTQGQLAFVSRRYQHLTDFIESPLQEKLSIANPKLAPYGLAAQQVLQKLPRWHQLTAQLIRSPNVNQAWQKIDAGIVNHGIVAYSQTLKTSLNVEKISPELYQPLYQQAVILKHCVDPELAQQFIRFLISAPIQQQLSSLGYLSVLPVQGRSND